MVHVSNVYKAENYENRMLVEIKIVHVHDVYKADINESRMLADIKILQFYINSF